MPDEKVLLVVDGADRGRAVCDLLVAMGAKLVRVGPKTRLRRLWRRGIGVPFTALLADRAAVEKGFALLPWLRHCERRRAMPCAPW